MTWFKIWLREEEPPLFSGSRADHFVAAQRRINAALRRAMEIEVIPDSSIFYPCVCPICGEHEEWLS